MSGNPNSRRPGIDWSKITSRFAVELGPAIAFVVALQLAGLVWATALFMVVVVADTAFSWFRTRRLPVVPAAMTVVACVLGTLTITRDEANYIQMLPTIVNGSAAVAIVVGLFTDRLVLKTALEEGFRLTDAAWRRLSMRMAIYLFIIASVNEVLRHTVSTETWAWYKACVPVFNILFIVANLPTIRKNLVDREEEQSGEAPQAERA